MVVAIQKAETFKSIRWFIDKLFHLHVPYKIEIDLSNYDKISLKFHLKRDLTKKVIFLLRKNKDVWKVEIDFREGGRTTERRSYALLDDDGWIAFNYLLKELRAFVSHLS